LLWPDIFRRVTLMSRLFAGPPGLDAPGPESGLARQALAALDRPRKHDKHYQWYYATRAANDGMLLCRQGVYAFLRACYHSKSAGWPGNRPLCLNASTAELARMPTCNIMNPGRDTAQTVAAEMASPGMGGVVHLAAGARTACVQGWIQTY